MIKLATALVATGTAGFLLGDAPGATVAVTLWAAVLVASWLIRLRKAQAPRGAVERREPTLCLDIDEAVDDVARARNWDFGKRYEIARMARENQTMTFDELERRYDRGHRSAPDRIRKDATERPKMIVGMKSEIAILFVICILYILLIFSCSFSSYR